MEKERGNRGSRDQGVINEVGVGVRIQWSRSCLRSESMVKIKVGVGTSSRLGLRCEVRVGVIV